MTTDAGYASEVNAANDILKIAVIERHRHTGHIGIGYLKGYGLKEGQWRLPFHMILTILLWLEAMTMIWPLLPTEL